MEKKINQMEIVFPKQKHYTAKTAPQRTGKYCHLPSLTVQEQNIGVNDIVGQYMQGMVANGNNPETAQWNDEDENPIGIDLKRLDLTELDQLQQRNAELINKAKTEIEANRKATAEQQKAEEIEEAIKKREAEKTETTL